MTGSLAACLVEQVDAVVVGERVDWRWTLAPREPGQQRLSVSLRLRWTPQPGVEGRVREVPIYSRGLDVQVISFMGLNRRQTMLAGLSKYRGNINVKNRPHGARYSTQDAAWVQAANEEKPDG